MILLANITEFLATIAGSGPFGGDYGNERGSAVS
jgi:hypothetical protein